MNKLRQTLLLAYLFIPSLGCTAAGLWLGICSAITGNHKLAGFGMILFMGGMTVVPAVLVIVANKFFRGERARHASSLRAHTPLRIKKLEKMLSQGRFMKRHPSVVFLFCLFALVVAAGMTLAPQWGPHHNHMEEIFLHWAGLVLGLAYCLILLFFFYCLLTKRWESYMDASIRKIEVRIAEAKQKTNEPRG